MTRNWLDYPITKWTTRKKDHITGVMEAYEERIKLLSNDSTRNFGSDYNDITWYYDYIAKLWGANYPKADSDHWPPHQSPDNEFKNNVIEDMRRLITYDTTTGNNSCPTALGDYDPPAVRQLIFPKHFIHPSDAFYRPFGSGNILDGTDFDYFQHLFNRAAYEDMNLTAGSVAVRVSHVDDLLDLLELFRQVWIPASNVEWRIKYGVSLQGADPFFDEMDDAWNSARDNAQADSWSAWQTDDAWRYLIWGRIYKRGSDGRYKAWVHLVETRLTFDLDLEISGMGWSVLPPISAKIIIPGYTFIEHDNISVTDETQADTLGWWDAEETATSFIKCSTTGASAEIPMATSRIRNFYVCPATGQKGYVLDGDITADIGTGHGAEQYVLTARDDFSDAEIDECKPDEPALGYVTAKYLQIWGDNGAAALGYIGGTGNYRGCEVANSSMGLCVVIEPDWHFGTE